MTADGDREQPRAHRTDGVVTAINKKIESFDEKKQERSGKPKSDGQPAGGLDKTPLPDVPPGFTIKVTFHSASNLPFADLGTLSSDPFVLAQLNTKLHTRHKQDTPIRWRTPTIHKSIEPVWESEWIVANVPSSGFDIKARIYDEDPTDHDDRLGNVHITCDDLSETWPGIKHEAFKIKKRAGSKRAYLVRGCAAMFSRSIKMAGSLVVSVEVLGKTDSGHGGRIWTIGPCVWTKHQSPMIGRLAGTKSSDKGDKTQTYEYAIFASSL